jgi:hypothetical protein
MTIIHMIKALSTAYLMYHNGYSVPCMKCLSYITSHKVNDF